ncbi:MAG: DUF480 domain-containing protein [Deltaproteobacteria bacterium]|nr:DUF480 domain-containing protein [Deltaproteobacteria bacterium]
MTFNLNPVEARIIGVLIEKQVATPDYYPLTLKALTTACNQKTNRQPVMNLDEAGVTDALDSLRKQHLVWQVASHGSRTYKYSHNLKDVTDFYKRELAVLCELLLRGPQTPGELRSRTARLYEFEERSDVERIIEGLMAHESGPFIVKLPRQPGRKEHRYAHLFSEVDLSETEDVYVTSAPMTDKAVQKELIEALEQKVTDLQADLERLREEFMAFKQQFE